MNVAKNIYARMVFSSIIMATSAAHAATMTYTLDDVVLTEYTRMTGTFSWTFAIDDFVGHPGTTLAQFGKRVDRNPRFQISRIT